VAVTSYSWQATANTIELCGARPVFVDVDESTYNMSPESLDDAIAALRRADRGSDLKAIMPVHAFGFIADMSEISAIAAELDVPVVEDAACALGAELEGAPAGSLGDIGCFSFHPRKVITTGEGGAIATERSDLASFARAFRNHGQSADPGTRDFVMAGSNFRLTEIQAALGRSQLARLDAILARRREQVSRYAELLQGSSVAIPTQDPKRTSAQAFVVVLPESVDRSRVMAGLSDGGIATSIGTIAMPFTRHFSHQPPVVETSLAVTRRLDHSALALPLFDAMTGEEQERVIESLIRLVPASQGAA
jgi:dTDP-4-amino-4,6-dideoxygalactose transaminase